MKPEAFILTGSFYVISRAPRFLAEVTARGLKVLVITPSAWREAALAAAADPGDAAAAITDFAFTDGDLRMENSYLPGVIAGVRRWLEEYTIVGICTVGETLVEPSAVVADALGLRAPGPRAGRACRSKYLQRLYAPEFSPGSQIIPAAGRASLTTRVGFPAVLKPAARHSSSGVWTVRDEQELRERVADYPDYETLLVEEKVVGPEYSVESLVQDGKVIFSWMLRKGTTDQHDDTFVELSHTLANEPCRERDILLEANQRLLELLDFRDGIAHAEWRLTADGTPYLMEVAARPPGDGIPALYGLATGSPIEPEVVRIALGEPASYPLPMRQARQVYLEHEPGLLTDVTLDWPGVTPQWVHAAPAWPEVEPGGPDDPPTLRAVFVLKPRGHRLERLCSSDDRAVTFLIDAPTVAELDELERRVRAALTIRLEG